MNSRLTRLNHLRILGLNDHQLGGNSRGTLILIQLDHSHHLIQLIPISFISSPRWGTHHSDGFGARLWSWRSGAVGNPGSLQWLWI